MIERLKVSYQQEGWDKRKQRMIPAASYGALIATTYVLSLSLINAYTFPNLPLKMDWGRMLSMWLGYTVALAFLGAAAAWFTEDNEGVVGGGLFFSVLLGIAFLFSSRAMNSTSIIQSIIMAALLVGVNMLGALGLRWTARRHHEILQQEKSSMRMTRLAKHVGLIVLVGLIPGVLGRMDGTSEYTLNELHELLQAAPNDPSVWARLPLKQVPTLKDHFGVDYVFYQRPSALQAGALDVTVRFEDGFTMTCLLPTTGSFSFITQCSEGDALKATP